MSAKRTTFISGEYRISLLLIVLVLFFIIVVHDRIRWHHYTSSGAILNHTLQLQWRRSSTLIMRAYVIDIPCANCHNKSTTLAHDRIGQNHQRLSQVAPTEGRTGRKWFTPRPVLYNADLYEEVSDYAVYNEGDGLFEDYFTLKRKMVAFHRVKFLKSPSPCSHKTVILVMVISKASNFNERTLIRSTWAHNLTDTDIYVVFMMGYNSTVHSKNLQEAEFYQNVLIFSKGSHSFNRGSSKSSEGNLARTEVMPMLFGLQWVRSNCPHVKHVIKTDDMSFINMGTMTSFLRQNNLTGSVVGAIERASLAPRSGEQSVSRGNFPFVYFPPYVSGTSYVLSGDLVKSFLYASNRFQHRIPLENVYLTGVLARTVSARHIHHAGFQKCITRHQNGTRRHSTCGRHANVALAVSGVSIEDMKKLHESSKRLQTLDHR